MSQAEVNPFSDASILQSLRLKLKGACYKQGGKKIDIKSFFPPGQDTATFGELKHVVRRELKLSYQFSPDPALAKLVAYLSSPLLNLHLESGMGPNPSDLPHLLAGGAGSRSPSPGGVDGGGNNNMISQGRCQSPSNTQQHMNMMSGDGYGGGNGINIPTTVTANGIQINGAAGDKQGRDHKHNMSTLSMIRNNPVIGDMLTLPLLPGELPVSSVNAITNASVFKIAELQRFIQHGAPAVSEKAERIVRKFQVAIWDKIIPLVQANDAENVVQQYQTGGIPAGGGPSSNINLANHQNFSSISTSPSLNIFPPTATAQDIKIYKVKQNFLALLKNYTRGRNHLNLHELKKFLRERLDFMNWDFGETDCTVLWYAMYRFPDLNLLEQCRIAGTLSTVGEQNHEPIDFEFSSGAGGGHLFQQHAVSSLTKVPSAPAGLHGIKQNASQPGAPGGSNNKTASSTGTGGHNTVQPQLSPRQRRIEKWLYPKNDQEFVFYVSDLVRLMDLPKKSGLDIEHPDFRMPNTSEKTTYQLEGAEDPKLQERYRQWCMARHNLSSNFSSTGRQVPPRTRMHAGTVQQHQWRLNHTLGY